MLTAGEFCSRDVVVVSPHDKITAVAKQMREHHVGSVLVVEFGPRGQVPLGVLTDRDIVVNLLALRPEHLDRALALEVMSDKLVTAVEHEDLDEVAQRMRTSGIRRIPVVSADGALKGVIAFDDLVEHLAGQIARLSGVLRRQRNQEDHTLHTRGERSPTNL